MLGPSPSTYYLHSCIPFAPFVFMFSDEETKAQEAWVTQLGHTAGRLWSLNFDKQWLSMLSTQGHLFNDLII